MARADPAGVNRMGGWEIALGVMNEKLNRTISGAGPQQGNFPISTLSSRFHHRGIGFLNG
jgi:hypothetical protein